MKKKIELMDNQVRVRFAPSPTGALHIGGVRTALFNYLFAKGKGGKMILRIEDTDQSRYVAGAEDYIQESLAWVGIKFDEGPKQGGEFGPYRQSERKEIYQKYAQQLIDDGYAYYAFDTPDELEAMRNRLKEAKVDNPVYNAVSRVGMSNSLTLSSEETKSRIEKGDPYVIRLKVPIKEEVRLNDMVRSWVVVHSSAIDDKILMKSDGMPTYHLANVVDDYLMKITHVIRGEEWLPSAPLHVLLYRFLGWEESMPTFAHLPLLLKPDGNGKLSKRDSDKHGFPIFPIDGTFPGKDGQQESFIGFREQGYIPEAFVNFLTLLGWNPGGEKEIYSLDELIKDFDIDRIQKGGAKFDIEKAKWFNQQYLRLVGDDELIEQLKDNLSQNSLTLEDDKLKLLIQLMKERVSFVNEMITQAGFIFESPNQYDDKVIKKRWTEEAVSVITELSSQLEKSSELDANGFHDLLNGILEAKGVQIGRVMQALRVAITGLGSGPDLMITMAILGSQEVNDRLKNALTVLSSRIKVSS